MVVGTPVLITVAGAAAIMAAPAPAANTVPMIFRVIDIYPYCY
ncbi:putative membrane protein [Mycobacteroides abscessus 3A-0930-S]|nr:putative membrane protein [Mycobacteroides abscessus 6G-0125-S]EIV57533.1 putative membrane protein [Mycobacteroides abscessus 3A-0930-S]EIV61919.1 putative membrane protein [Mycobacteroides abscessus 4S-0116-S]